MPTTKVELDDGNEALDRVVYIRYREEELGVAHEAIVDLC